MFVRRKIIIFNHIILSLLLNHYVDILVIKIFLLKNSVYGILKSSSNLISRSNRIFIKIFSFSPLSRLS